MAVIMGNELKKVEEIVESVFDQSLEEVTIPARHIFKYAGRRLRPLLTLLACTACGGRLKDAFAPAAGLELVHSAFLIHDDIIDDDTMRSSMPSAHAVYGEELAMTAGDYLLVSGIDMVGATMPPSKAKPAMGTISKAARLANEGQALGIVMQRLTNVKEDDYLTMVEYKTGALISAAAEIGAIIAGASAQKRKALAEFGRNLGIAFHLHKDLINVTKKNVKGERPWGLDIREGKRTLMIVKCLENPASNAELTMALGKLDASDDEVEDIISIMKEVGALKYTEQKIKEYRTAAKTALKAVPKSKARSLLERIADTGVEEGF